VILLVPEEGGTNQLAIGCEEILSPSSFDYIMVGTGGTMAGVLKCSDVTSNWVFGLKGTFQKRNNQRDVFRQYEL
jgi:hypothetical protein